MSLWVLTRAWRGPAAVEAGQAPPHHQQALGEPRPLPFLTLAEDSVCARVGAQGCMGTPPGSECCSAACWPGHLDPDPAFLYV